MNRLILIALIGWLVSMGAAHATNKASPKPESLLILKSFYQSLQNDLATNNIQAFATKIRYPFRVFIHGQPEVFNNQAEFIAEHELILTDELKAGIACQTFETLYHNIYKGTSGVRGSIWIQHFYVGPLKNYKDYKDTDRTDPALWQHKISTLNLSPYLSEFVAKCQGL